MSRILVVSYYHAPAPGIGGSRWAAMARHLRALGHEVTLVASDAWGDLPDDAERDVVRARDLRSWPPLRRLLRRGELPTVGGSGVELPPTALLTKVVVPDALALTWLPAAVRTVRRLLERTQYDCLVTSSPPESAHVIGLLLGRRRPPWLADFRDGWSFERLRDRFPTAPQRALDEALERRIVRTAEVTVAATRPIAADFQQRVGAEASWVPNGWDRTLVEPSPEEAPAGPRVRLVHTGSLSGGWGRDPRPFVEALARVAGEPGERRLSLVHAGRLTPEEDALLARLGETVERHGLVDREAALALQRSADALVLLTSGNRSEATGKLFEYLASGRPILALAEGNEAARIVAETGTGVTVRPDDVDAIAAALRSVARGELERAYAPRGLEPYTYPAPADAMAGLVEEAIRRRPGR